MVRRRLGYVSPRDDSQRIFGNVKEPSAVTAVCPTCNQQGRFRLAGRRYHGECGHVVHPVTLALNWSTVDHGVLLPPIEAR